MSLTFPATFPDSIWHIQGPVLSHPGPVLSHLDQYSHLKRLCSLFHEDMKLWCTTSLNVGKSKFWTPFLILSGQVNYDDWYTTYTKLTPCCPCSIIVHIKYMGMSLPIFIIWLGGYQQSTGGNQSECRTHSENYCITKFVTYILT